MSLLEVCISSDDTARLADNMATAIEFGAKRFELCGQMQHDGLTPSAQAIKIAKQQTTNKAHLAVMIRPRAGDFCYNPAEVEQMVTDINMAAEFGADSVVFGLTHDTTKTIDTEAVLKLVSACKKHDIGYVFHRAFDTLDEPVQSLQWLAEQGFSRILTAGTRWGAKATLEQGLGNILQWLKSADVSTEIIIGGGLNHNNIDHALITMAPFITQVSFHTHSAVLEDGRVSGQLISNFVNKIKQKII